MTVTDDTLTIARSYSEAMNAKNWDKLRNEILAPAVESWSHSAQHLERGPEEIIAALQKTSGSVANTRTEIYNTVAEGDQAVIELRLHGTAYGDPNDPTNTAAASGEGEGRPVTLSTCHVYRVKDGKIWRHATYSDRTWRFDKPE